MRQIDAKGIVKKLKENNDRVESVNLTLRLHKDLRDQFKGVCKREKLKVNSVVTELIRQFVEGNKGR